MTEPLQAVFDAGDNLLRFAPHNMLVALFAGGALGPQLPVPAGVALKQYATLTGQYSKASEWGPGKLSVRVRGSKSKIKVTAPKDMALVLTIQPMKRKTVEKRAAPLASLEKVWGESDISFLTRGVPRTVVIGPEHPLSIEEVVPSKSESEEKGPFGVITWKKTTVDNAIDVVLVGVMYKEKEVPVPGGEADKARKKVRRG